jgi:hypothetical protein
MTLIKREKQEEFFGVSVLGIREALLADFGGKGDR